MTEAATVATARFVEGSIMRHVVVMTLTGAVGLMSLFIVDLADLFFLSLLGNTDITAAIGFAGMLSFANLSMSIGAGIASAALVARNLGAGDRDRAKSFATNALALALAISTAYTLLIAFYAVPILSFLGAKGEALQLAKIYIWTLTPGFVLLAGAVSCSFALRGLGDPTRAMFITLSAAIVTAFADPLFIFVLDWGIQGAAVAHVLSNIVAITIGLQGLVRAHKFLNHFKVKSLFRDFLPIWAIALPAILTQLATPFAVAYTTYAIAPFGNEAVAASAIIGRIVPVAFGIIFALSGSVGPIIGQNYGAGNLARVWETLVAGLVFSSAYTLATSLLLFVFRYPLAEAFNASGQTRDLVIFFCTYVAVSWAFAGAQFVANAAFNNLGRPMLSTWFNWGKSTIGTIPFAIAGAAYYGAAGIFGGIAVGSVVFGIASIAIAFRIVATLMPNSNTEPKLSEHGNY